MLSYIISILSVFGNTAITGMNTVVVTIDRNICNNVVNRLFSLGGRRVGGNSSMQLFKVYGVDVKITYE